MKYLPTTRYSTRFRPPRTRLEEDLGIMPPSATKGSPDQPLTPQPRAPGSIPPGVLEPGIQDVASRDRDRPSW